MKAIHGAKTKNDKIDTHKMAVLLRGGLIPMAYVYPPQMRSTRDHSRFKCALCTVCFAKGYDHEQILNLLALIGSAVLVIYSDRH